MPPEGASRKLIHWNTKEKIILFCLTLVGFWLVFDELFLSFGCTDKWMTSNHHQTEYTNKIFPEW